MTTFHGLDGAIEIDSAGGEHGDTSKGEPLFKKLYTGLTIRMSDGRGEAWIRLTPETRLELAEYLGDRERLVVQTFAGPARDMLVDCLRCGRFVASELDVVEAFGCPRCKCRNDGRDRRPWDREAVLFFRGDDARQAMYEMELPRYPISKDSYRVRREAEPHEEIVERAGEDRP
jgi:hypothetical protein